jgi:hypothetical protein
VAWGGGGLKWEYFYVQLVWLTEEMSVANFKNIVHNLYFTKCISSQYHEIIKLSFKIMILSKTRFFKKIRHLVFYHKKIQNLCLFICKSWHFHEILKLSIEIINFFKTGFCNNTQINWLRTMKIVRIICNIHRWLVKVGRCVGVGLKWQYFFMFNLFC